ncbi:efflux RND transporter permease subunit, partial [Acinetobacter baumannii]
MNNFNEFGRQYKTFIQADIPYRMSPNDISQFFMRDNKGNMVSMGTFAKVRDTTGPLYTNRFNLYRTA